MFERRLNHHPATSKAGRLLEHLSHLLVVIFFASPWVFCFSTLCAAGAEAQNFSIQHWETRNGLRTPAVTSVTQTLEGDLWIGTRAELARFNGSQFETFTPRNLPGLNSRYIDYVATGPDSTLYVGTDEGLCVFIHGHSRSFLTQRGNTASKVLMILPVGNDEAWIGTRFGVLFHYENGAIEAAGFPLPAEAAIFGLAKASDGALWLATTHGLFSISQGKMARYQPDAPLPTQAFHSLSVSRDGTLFAASDKGLFGIRGGQWNQWNKATGLPSDEFNVLAKDPQGALWIGTRAGLARLERGIVRPVDAVSCSVSALYVDGDKSLWIGCNDAIGLSRLTTHDFPFLSLPRALDIASASLALDHTGAVWVGSHCGLYKYVDGKFRLFTTRDGLPNDWINAVSVSGGDTIWVATKDGVARIDNGHITPVHNKDTGFEGSFLSVLEGLDGALWVTSEQGLGRRLPGQTVLSFESGLTNLVESMYQDNSGALWVSTDLHGLFRFLGGTREEYRKTCGIGSDTVYSSVQDESGTMWAWTSGGLSRIRGSKCANISPDAGLPKSEAGSIACDRAGHLWLRTQNGVAAIDIAEANEVIDSPVPLQRRSPLQKTRFVGSEQGLDSDLNDFETLSLMVMRDSGRIWVPTAAGIAVLDASSIQRSNSNQQTRPQVTSFVTDSGEHDITAPVRLQPDDLHLRFTYRIPSLLGTRGRMFRYRLSGFDKDWRDGQENGNAAYTSIPAGTYRFEVSSRQSFEPWSAVSDPVELTLLPHFYRTWWWYSLLAVAAAGAIWLSYLFRLVAVRRQYAAVFAERDRERSRLARELHDTLSRGMMAIHMQLQLARALLPADPSTACNHLDTAVDIVRESALETRKSIAALRAGNEEARSLKYLLDRTAASFKAHSKISLETHIDPALPPLEVDVEHEIAQIVEEALSNVIQHSGAQTARLSASTAGNLLRIQIVDNGRGFDIESYEPAELEHFGIQGMRERAETIHANLTTAYAPGEGTTVVLEVPIGSATP